MRQENSIQTEDRHRISKILWYLYCLFLVLSVVIIGRIAYIQFIWEPDELLETHFRPKKHKNVIEPERGSIMDCNGKLLALSTPMYNINMDCKILKDIYENEEDPISRDTLERNWRRKAEALSKELPKVLQEEGKEASYYYNLIISKRESKQKNDGSRNVSIAKNVDHETLKKLRTLPLFKESRYRSGMKVTKVNTRQYPYEGLAARIIGDVKIDKDNPEDSRFVGIEGQYNHILHGTEGIQWMKQTDKGRILDPDSTEVAVQHGKDIRLTLDIDIQDIADRALRMRIMEDDKIESGCIVVMEVATGAVKAMVNLKRDRNNNFRETFNMAVGQPGEPGSVFKAASLMTLLEDGKVTLGTEVPTNHGRMPDMSNIPVDSYITKWERSHNTDKISVLDGFKISSNYVFRRLVTDNYRNDPKAFINRLYDYKLNDAYTFDLEEKGGTKSRLPDPDSKYWSITDLASTAIGYSVMETPLNIVTFYNAIANDGKMMKPYIIASHEQDGRTCQEFGPEILNGAICSKATADTLTRALKMVTLEGTAAKLKNAKCEVAGKTGTARIVIPKDIRGNSSDPYKDGQGRMQYQATFVGFFPADEPKYTAIVTVYTRLTSVPVYGSSTPAMTFKEIVDDLWALDTDWGKEYTARAGVPEMRPQFIGTRQGSVTPVPDVTGMGLKDALYAIENNGYRCSYEGMGHVVSQNPAAGTEHKKGQTVRLVLR